MITLDDFMHPSMVSSFFRSIENSNMQRINLFAFYQLGKVLRNVKDVFHDERLNVGEKMRCVNQTQDWVLSFLEKTRRVNAEKSITIAQKLLEALNKYYLTLFDGSGEFLKDELAPKMIINHLIEEFEESFDEESKHLGSFLVTQKGIYDTEKLISDASKRFEPEVLKHLPDIAIDDFKEAGKCLAFECPTAMAYHILRAIEAVILKYYEAITGHAWKRKQKGWWLYIEELKGLPSKPVPTSITQRLNEIRKYERNPIAHPGFFLDLKDAMPFFDLCSGVIPLMAQEIEKIELAKNT
jgi:hypothetical protein